MKLTATVSYVSFLTDDLDALASWWANLLSIDEITTLRSPIFRALQADNLVLGFHADEAHDLLDLPRAQGTGVRTFITFDLPAPEQVDEMFARAVDAGATAIKAPFETYYNAHQVVLEDPERNVFRFNYQRAHP